jgi:hypothetical protein
MKMDMDPCSRLGRINIEKIAIYSFNEVPMSFFTEMVKSVLKFTWKHKRPLIKRNCE